MNVKQARPLYSCDGGDIAQGDIEAALAEAGVAAGDAVLLYSDLGTIGRLSAVRDKGEFLQAILEAFMNVLGPGGTLIVPTYTYSFARGEAFDVRESPSRVGVFSEFVRRHPDAVRSEDPFFSHAGIGREAGLLLDNVGSSCFGEDSFFDRFYKRNGRIVNMGFPFAVTYLHYIENAFGARYRAGKKFSGTVVASDGTRRMKEVVYYAHYLRKEERGFDYRMSVLGDELKSRGMLNRVRLGNSHLLCTTAKDSYDVGLEMLRDDEHVFLTHRPYVLRFDKFPFFTNFLDSPKLDPPKGKDLPLTLPFELEYDDDSGIISQRYSPETARHVKSAYEKGSQLSTNLGRGSFGEARARDMLKYLLAALGGSVRGLRFLEVGCADGYLLNELKLLGAGEVVGCEPGPMAKEGRDKFGINIVNDFFRPRLFRDKFDVIYSYGVLEHLRGPVEAVASFLECLKEKGRVFAAVPNFVNKMELGDIGVLSHEHWNYFTAESLRNLLKRGGLSDAETQLGINQAMIYGWGEKRAGSAAGLESRNSDKEAFCHFYAKVNGMIPVLRERFLNLSKEGRSLGFYGGGLKLLGVLGLEVPVRFFNADKVKVGKFYPGYQKPIEAPRNLLTEKVDELWVMPVDYDKEITDYLKHELKISADINVVSFKGWLNAYQNRQ